MRLAGWLLALAPLAPVHAAPTRKGPPRSVLLVGWDGADRRHIDWLRQRGKLPNLTRLIERGSYAATNVTTGATETKPGWAEILTGRNADAMGIENNIDYRPITEGETIFEKARAAYGGGLYEALITGKGYNIGARGPHEICVNCWPREPKLDWGETYWWDRARSIAHTRGGLPARWVWRSGEPFFYAAKVLDLRAQELGGADDVGPRVLAALDACGKKPFFIFAHFDDPDEAGHRHTDQDPRYDAALEADDAWLGRLLDRLKERGLQDGTTVVVVTDHGFEEQSRFHAVAPLTWLVSNRPGWRTYGDRKDAGATVLRELGLDAGGLPGVPLQDVGASTPPALSGARP